MTPNAPDNGSTLTVERLDVFVFRAPSDPPVQTSFGIMRDRPAVLVRLTDVDGAVGWGEIWCNFPTVGAEHRARMALAAPGRIRANASTN
jgi:D-galactarolactone cycloisomerase